MILRSYNFGEGVVVHQNHILFSHLPFKCGFPPDFPVSTLYMLVNNERRNKNQYQ